MAADVAIHAPHREGDQRNRHAHVLTTTRVMGEGGLGDKTRVLDAARTGGPEIEAMREIWGEMQNRALEREGHDERVDHRSLEVQREEALERGDAWTAEELDRVPEVKLGPAANAMERRERAAAADEGRDYVPVTERGAQVQASREAHGLVREMRERVERAREVWERARDDGQDRVRAGAADGAACRAKGAARRGQAGQG